MAKNRGFESVKAVEPRRLCMSVCGRQKEGKTHFALTAPEPIVFFDMDDGLEGPINNPQFKKKKIMAKKYIVPNLPDTARAKQFETMWNDFMRDLEWALDYAKGGTVVVDSGTQLFALCRLAHFGGKLKQNAQFYDVINGKMDMIWTMAKEQNETNFLVLHRMKPVYAKTDKKDEEASRILDAYEPSGWSGTGYAAQAELFLRRRSDKTHTVTIADCRHNPDAEGEMLKGKLCNFDCVAQTILPDWGEEEDDDEDE